MPTTTLLVEGEGYFHRDATILKMPDALDLATDQVAVTKVLGGVLSHATPSGVGGHAEAVVCDVRDEGSVLQLFATARQTHGRVDVLFNNAGVVSTGTATDELSLEATCPRSTRHAVHRPRMTPRPAR